MSRHPTLRGTVAVASLTLLTLSTASAAALDPHQRAREVIVPPVMAAAPQPAGAMGRIIEPDSGVDGHTWARSVLRPEPLAAGSSAFRSTGDDAGMSAADSHQRARRVIGNRD